MADSSSTDVLDSIDFEKDWIIDWGCGHHLTGNESKFSSLHRHAGNKAIITTDNTVHPVKKEGSVVLNDQNCDAIALKSIFHVPGVNKYLLSVANVVDSGHYVLFRPKDVKFLKNVKC